MPQGVLHQQFGWGRFGSCRRWRVMAAADCGISRSACACR